MRGQMNKGGQNKSLFIDFVPPPPPAFVVVVVGFTSYNLKATRQILF